MANSIINTRKAVFATMMSLLAMGVAATTAVQAGAGTISKAAAAGTGVVDAGVHRLRRAKSLLDHSPNRRVLQAVDDMSSMMDSSIAPDLPTADVDLAPSADASDGDGSGSPPSTWSPSSSPTSAPSSAGDNDDAQDGNVATCLTEFMGCMGDESCAQCLTGASEDSCEISGPTCSETVDLFCCTYGDTCNDNALLVTYVDCTLNDSGCTVESDLCDTEDDNGTLVGTIVTGEGDDDRVLDACSDELNACREDEACTSCMTGSPDGCDNYATDCDGLADYYCCMAGVVEGCSTNALILDFVNCNLDQAEANNPDVGSCTLTELCGNVSEDDDASGDDAAAVSGDDGDDNPVEVCSIQFAACQEDETCGACFSEAVVDGTCDNDAADCDDVASYYCCLIGGKEGCRDNAMLLEYVNCGIELDSCTLTDVCQDLESAPDNGANDDGGSVPEAPADGEHDHDDEEDHDHEEDSGAAGAFSFFGSSGGGGASVIGAAAAVVGGFLAINVLDHILV